MVLSSSGLLRHEDSAAGTLCPEITPQFDPDLPSICLAIKACDIDVFTYLFTPSPFQWLLSLAVRVCVCICVCVLLIVKLHNSFHPGAWELGWSDLMILLQLSHIEQIFFFSCLLALSLSLFPSLSLSLLSYTSVNLLRELLQTEFSKPVCILRVT